MKTDAKSSTRHQQSERNGTLKRPRIISGIYSRDAKDGSTSVNQPMKYMMLTK